MHSSDEKSAIKNTFCHPKRDEPARISFQSRIKSYQNHNKPIIVIDESGFAHDRPRTHGSTLQGKHNGGALGRTNIIGAWLNQKLLTVTLLNGSVDADVFKTWVMQELLPKIPKKSMIVMLLFTSVKDIQDSLTAAGHIWEYLPTYSPDLNPIEHTWPQCKLLRRSLYCSFHDLFTSHVLYLHYIILAIEQRRGMFIQDVILPTPCKQSYSPSSSR